MSCQSNIESCENKMRVMSTYYLCYMGLLLFIDKSNNNRDCQSGKFGKNCELDCNCKYVTEACHPNTGKCVSGCRDLFGGPSCLDCVTGHFGDDCTSQCHCRTKEQCHRRSGRCPSGCDTSYTGESCNDLIDTESITIIVLLSLSAVIIVGLVIFIVVIVTKRRSLRASRENPIKIKWNSYKDNGTLESVSSLRTDTRAVSSLFSRRTGSSSKSRSKSISPERSIIGEKRLREINIQEADRADVETLLVPKRGEKARSVSFCRTESATEKDLERLRERRLYSPRHSLLVSDKSTTRSILRNREISRPTADRPPLDPIVTNLAPFDTIEENMLPRNRSSSPSIASRKSSMESYNERYSKSIGVKMLPDAKNDIDKQTKGTKNRKNQRSSEGRNNMDKTSEDSINAKNKQMKKPTKCKKEDTKAIEPPVAKRSKFLVDSEDTIVGLVFSGECMPADEFGGEIKHNTVKGVKEIHKQFAKDNPAQRTQHDESNENKLVPKRSTILVDSKEERLRIVFSKENILTGKELDH